MTSYPAELAKHLAAGLSVPQAQKIIHKEFPGLRRKHEQTSGMGKILEKLTAANAPAAPAPAAPRYEPVTNETARVASGMSKAQWEARKSKIQVAEPISNTSTGDYFQLVRAERQRTGCNFKDAAIAINKRCPQAWAKMLEAANPGRSFQHRIRK